LNDHSAFDAYSFLVEADGKSLFYSADFRGHGRKSRLFDQFLKTAPKPVDVLLMEGTTIGRDDGKEVIKSETDLWS
jgi:ribonuclease J